MSNESSDEDIKRTAETSVADDWIVWCFVESKAIARGARAVMEIVAIDHRRNAGHGTEVRRP